MTPITRIRARNTYRLIPSLYPSEGILDRIASPEDLPFLFELESWSNDRISDEYGLLHRIPLEEWVSGKPMSSVVMAAFCHPRPGGGRFNGADRGAWYAARDLDTAHAEVTYHRTAELAEVGVFETRLEMRLYLASFNCLLHDIRVKTPLRTPLYSPTSYTASQAFARDLFLTGSNGLVYCSVRRDGGECIACFRPKLVESVRMGGHFEYRWEGGRTPAIRKLAG